MPNATGVIKNRSHLLEDIRLAKELSAKRPVNKNNRPVLSQEAEIREIIFILSKTIRMAIPKMTAETKLPTLKCVGRTV